MDQDIGATENEFLCTEVGKGVDRSDHELSRNVEGASVVIEVVELEVARVVPGFVVREVLVRAAHGEERPGLAITCRLTDSQGDMVPLTWNHGILIECGLLRDAAHGARGACELPLGIAHV